MGICIRYSFLIYPKNVFCAKSDSFENKQLFKQRLFLSKLILIVEKNKTLPFIDFFFLVFGVNEKMWVFIRMLI